MVTASDQGVPGNCPLAKIYSQENVINRTVHENHSNKRFFIYHQLEVCYKYQFAVLLTRNI